MSSAKKQNFFKSLVFKEISSASLFVLFLGGWWNLIISDDYEIHKFVLGLSLLTVAMIPCIFVIYEIEKRVLWRKIFILLAVIFFIVLFGGSFFWKHLTTGTASFKKTEIPPTQLLKEADIEQPT